MVAFNETPEERSSREFSKRHKEDMSKPAMTSFNCVVGKKITLDIDVSMVIASKCSAEIVPGLLQTLVNAFLSISKSESPEAHEKFLHQMESWRPDTNPPTIDPSKLTL